MLHTHTALSQTIFHTQLCHTHTMSQPSHTTLHIQLLKLSILQHLLCPFCFLCAASCTLSDHDHWKKLTCGVIRSFNCQTRFFNSLQSCTCLTCFRTSRCRLWSMEWGGVQSVECEDSEDNGALSGECSM